MVEDIDASSPGSSRTSPMMAFLLAMLLFSLAGIPPLAGFFAKFYVFLAAIHAGLYALAVIGVLVERRGCLLLSSHRQDHVFRRSCRTLRADAGAACRRAWGERLVHSALFRLSGAACRACRSCSEVSVLNERYLHRHRRNCRAATDCFGWRRSTRPMPRRGAARWPASQVRCGSGRPGSRRAAAGAGASGSPSTAICSRAS